MIRQTKQNWQVGEAVRVGFLTLTVIAAIPTPGDYRPDAYILSSKTAFYRFVPHFGLEKIGADEARSEVAQRAAADASRVIARAGAEAQLTALVRELIEG